MTTARVPLVIYDGGERTVVGQAVVDMDADYGYLDVTALVTDEAARKKMAGRPVGSISIAYHTYEEDSPPSPYEVAYLPPLQFKPNVPKF